MEQTFAIAFETMLERVAGGYALDAAVREYHTPIDTTRFRTWVYRDNKRKSAYLMAKAVGAEAVEDQMLRIADGLDPDGNATIEDVARSTLKIGTRKWLLGVWNRKRYGDTKHVEQVTTSRFDVGSMSKDDLQHYILNSLCGNAQTGFTFDSDDI